MSEGSAQHWSGPFFPNPLAFICFVQPFGKGASLSAFFWPCALWCNVRNFNEALLFSATGNTTTLEPKLYPIKKVLFPFSGMAGETLCLVLLVFHAPWQVGLWVQMIHLLAHCWLLITVSKYCFIIGFWIILLYTFYQRVEFWGSSDVVLLNLCPWWTNSLWNGWPND